MARVNIAATCPFRRGTQVDEQALAEIHHKSHQECFIANSVKTDVAVEPQV